MKTTIPLRAKALFEDYGYLAGQDAVADMHLLFLKCIYDPSAMKILRKHTRCLALSKTRLEEEDEKRKGEMVDATYSTL